MSQELGTRKELSLEEANARVNSAIAKIKKNQISEPADTYEHISFRSSNILLIAMTIGGFSIGVLVNNPVVALLAFSGVIPASLNSWNGNPRHRIRNFFAKYVFTSKKKRLKLNVRQEEWKRYYELKALQRLYVSSIVTGLENDGVLEVINRHDPSKHVYFDKDGVYRHRIESNRVNETKASAMMKELAVLPHIKEQLLEELKSNRLASIRTYQTKEIDHEE